MEKGSSDMGAGDLYSAIIEKIFFDHYQDGDTDVKFRRSEILDAAIALGVPRPKNAGDVIYAFKFRRLLPESIRTLAPEGKEWIIRNAGRGLYAFGLITTQNIAPSELLIQTKIPDATPGVIKKYALNDEQSLLATLRYNRLIDLFLGLTCYSLQNHLRTTVPGIGQVETDEVYVGLDRHGAHYIVPVQAKGHSDRIGIAQIEQDFALCSHKFPGLTPRPVAAQFMDDHVIVLFEFEEAAEGLGISSEKHYRLVTPDELTDEELQRYRQRVST